MEMMLIDSIQNQKIIDKIRTGNGPAILELVTYRWYGHVDWREDIDVGVARSKEDIKDWKRRDPIHDLSQSMINLKFGHKDKKMN